MSQYSPQIPMTLKNAIKMIENLRNSEIFAAKSFSDDSFDEKYAADRIRRKMVAISQGKADYLANILSELRSVKMQRLSKKCRHPKKDHAITSDGQKYCMNCNADL